MTKVIVAAVFLVLLLIAAKVFEEFSRNRKPRFEYYRKNCVMTNAESKPAKTSQFVGGGKSSLAPTILEASLLQVAVSFWKEIEKLCHRNFKLIQLLGWTAFVQPFEIKWSENYVSPIFRRWRFMQSGKGN
jgi:hypothetical protein